MEWTRVKDHAEEIVNKCFTEENKQLLEFSINENVVSVLDQLLYHYQFACYRGSKDSLIKAIMYKIHQNVDILLRLKDLQTNYGKITELGEYSKVTMGYKEQLGTETTIGATGSESNTKNKQADNFSGTDTNRDISINDEQAANSQTNVVRDINIIMPTPTIKEIDKKRKSFQLEESNISEVEKDSKGYILDKPELKDGDNPLGFQNLTKNTTTSDTASTLNTETSRGSESKGDTKNRGASAKVKGAKSDEINRTAVFRTNDARLAIWKMEIPKLQTRFWNIFFNLFVYDEF